jgi:hypothetical protein
MPQQQPALRSPHSSSSRRRWRRAWLWSRSGTTPLLPPVAYQPAPGGLLAAAARWMAPVSLAAFLLVPLVPP